MAAAGLVTNPCSGMKLTDNSSSELLEQSLGREDEVKVPAPGSPNDADDMVRRQSPSAPQNQAKLSNFSICNILKPDFGKQTSVLPKTPRPRHANVLFTPPSNGFLYPALGHYQALASEAQKTEITLGHYQQSLSHEKAEITQTQLDQFYLAAMERYQMFSPQKYFTPNAAAAVMKPRVDDVYGAPCYSPPGRNNTHNRASPRASSPAVSSSSSSSTAGSPSSPSYTSPKLPQPGEADDEKLWPAWVYCTRYSDRPSSGPRSRKIKRKEKAIEEKRPRTAFTNDQLNILRKEFEENRYLTEQRRQRLSRDLDLNESQIKIWFQNKRAKMKKSTGGRNNLAMQLMAQGLYNHSTLPTDESP